MSIMCSCERPVLKTSDHCIEVYNYVDCSIRVY